MVSGWGSLKRCIKCRLVNTRCRDTRAFFNLCFPTSVDMRCRLIWALADVRRDFPRAVCNAMSGCEFSVIQNCNNPAAGRSAERCRGTWVCRAIHTTQPILRNTTIPIWLLQHKCFKFRNEVNPTVSLQRQLASPEGPSTILAAHCMFNKRTANVMWLCAQQELPLI